MRSSQAPGPTDSRRDVSSASSSSLPFHSPLALYQVIVGPRERLELYDTSDRLARPGFIHLEVERCHQCKTASRPLSFSDSYANLAATRRATLCCLLSFIILHAYAAAEPARTRLPPRLSSDIDQIIPSATLATESPIVFYSEHPALATSYLAAYSSLVVNNPTFFPSAANSFGDVAFSAPT